MPSNPTPNPTSDASSPDPAATALPPSPTVPTTTATTTPAAPTYHYTGPVIVTSIPGPARTRRPRAASISANVALASPSPTLASRTVSVPAYLDRPTYVTAYKQGFSLAISAVLDVLDGMKEEDTRGFWGRIEDAKEAVEGLQPREDVVGEEEAVGDGGVE